MSGDPRKHHHGKCPTCSSLRYVDRKSARKAARTIAHGTSLRAYQCDQYWHIGSKPEHIKRGDS